MRAGDNVEAIDHLSRAVEMDPHNADAFLNLAEALSRVGRHEDAVINLERALQFEPDNAGIRQALERVRRHE